ncbi:MAG TPA: ABC transporter substrate-binding protein [Bacteroidales bacterium]|nr:ABC transporter substrate-binding protein [Bacteroidales bacterium]
MVRSNIIFLLCIIALTCSCTGKSRHHGSETGSPSAHPGYAERFTLKEINGITVLTIKNPWQGADGISQEWYLLKRGDNIPAGIDSSRIIRVPVRKVIAMSTTFLSMIDTLGESDKITGISGTDLIYNNKLRSDIRNGKIPDVGYDDNLDKELIIKIKPDILMIYGVGGESSGLAGKLKELGIKVLFNADYLENDPLGKAEWIKVYGALFGKEKEADSIFSGTVSEYDDIREIVRKKATERPKVLLGLPWKDVWYVSPGNSYISRLISDAGGEYIWKDTESETSLPYGLETVWLKAAGAEYWLNISTVSDRGEILAVDKRLGDLEAFSSGKMYNNNNRVTAIGGNDYWESGSVRPQVILKDIASILHPGLFPGYTYCYFKKVK